MAHRVACYIPAMSAMPAPLLPDECRVLGVLVEKAQTTPAQYPLSLNGVVVGCNQKNNRDPVMNIDEDRALAALDGLRAKALAREVSMEGSRVSKFRHVARETLAVDTAQLVILTELLLRGPQTVGELRGRASRMHALDSMEVVENVLADLSGRTPPLVQEIAPLPGSRAPRWIQLLCPGLHPIDRASVAGSEAGSPVAHSAVHPDITALTSRVDRLERDMDAIRATLRELGASV